MRPVQPSWGIALPPAPAGTWYVCGAAPVPESFRPGNWQLLAQGLADRPAAEEWVRKHHLRFDELVHFAVDVNERGGGGVIEWEVFDRDREGDLYSSRDGRKL